MTDTLDVRADVLGRTLSADPRFKQILDRLVAMSERDYYDPYRLFDWPATVVEDAWWMSPELMTTHGTAVAERLDEHELMALSKWESVNFYSLNVHGIRELLTEMVARVHMPGYEVTSEYFHHIIGEENDHMWFFATFCLRYAGTIYPNASMSFPGAGIPEADTFLVFARLLLFEELVDVFNQRMAVDDRLDPTIRKINAVHHQDESRHIAFGRQIVALLHAELRRTLPAARIADLEAYLKRYMRSSAESLCNPAAFADAGIAAPYEARRQVLADPAFDGFVARTFKRSTGFMTQEHILSDDTIPAL
ncbi:P-aminobenzoate N-oxygenase AurF [Jatrophihabitans endophyticus]|uniref:p-aminobenzoate N-oxygenase AurF n=1 Tax=Jatrophihabitans endophyticus TaxID=1206085 RepID=A0A1M5REE2_9ACTN|nr:diiron oxygenase [Jatrophihabitans endophyticus]SHH24183.1 P-aminobenzoate N-oxygenase AurF [Jatrophihabitans endophyticus]